MPHNTSTPHCPALFATPTLHALTLCCSMMARISLLGVPEWCSGGVAVRDDIFIPGESDSFTIEISEPSVPPACHT